MLIHYFCFFTLFSLNITAYSNADLYGTEVTYRGTIFFNVAQYGAAKDFMNFIAANMQTKYSFVKSDIYQDSCTQRKVSDIRLDIHQAHESSDFKKTKNYGISVRERAPYAISYKQGESIELIRNQSVNENSVRAMLGLNDMNSSAIEKESSALTNYIRSIIQNCLRLSIGKRPNDLASIFKFDIDCMSKFNQYIKEQENELKDQKKKLLMDSLAEYIIQRSILNVQLALDNDLYVQFKIPRVLEKEFYEYFDQFSFSNMQLSDLLQTAENFLEAHPAMKDIDENIQALEALKDQLANQEKLKEIARKNPRMFLENTRRMDFDEMERDFRVNRSSNLSKFFQIDDDFEIRLELPKGMMQAFKEHFPNIQSFKNKPKKLMEKVSKFFGQYPDIGNIESNVESLADLKSYIENIAN